MKGVFLFLAIASFVLGKIYLNKIFYVAGIVWLIFLILPNPRIVVRDYNKNKKF